MRSIYSTALAGYTMNSKASQLKNEIARAGRVNTSAENSTARYKLGFDQKNPNGGPWNDQLTEEPKAGTTQDVTKSGCKQDDREESYDAQGFQTQCGCGQTCTNRSTTRNEQ